MKAMRLHAICDFACEEVELPELKDDEILLKVGACGVCGSDIPRVFELGAHVFPITIGHEFAGTVVKTANKKDEDLIGKKAAIFPLIPCGTCEFCKEEQFAQCTNYNYLGSRCDGGFAEYCVIPSKWQLVFSNDENTSMESLSLVEPATVAQHAVRKAKISEGSNVLILGAGPIGLLAARFSKLFGAGQVALTDISDEKIDFAQEKGFQVFNTLEEGSAKEIQGYFKNHKIDVVIEGTGSTPGLNTAIELIKPFGRIVMLGNPHGDTMIQLQNHSSILRKEIEFYGVWNSIYSDKELNEWKYTVEMIDTGKLKVDDLITHKVKLEDVAKLFSQIYHREITVCKAIYSKEV
ncbi:MAG: galactitol-1-phosphate 5-dehydrogenase [Anaerostipes sp.]|nr:galactitol-1-phosphate 5-dehydrogenase [Anaerostipes sp.]